MACSVSAAKSAQPPKPNRAPKRPATRSNDDLLAIGVILEDVDTSSEPLMVIPGTHKGPVLSHFHGSVFAGAIDPADPLFARDGIVTSPAGRDR